MATKIFHPNISKKGEICVDTLKKGWRKDYGVGHVLTVIKCLLIVPNPDSALDEEAGKQLNEDYDGYCKYAKLITGIHATPKVGRERLLFVLRANVLTAGSSCPVPRRDGCAR
jgi:ubiquitin-conjugating enzyme E2 S